VTRLAAALAVLLTFVAAAPAAAAPEGADMGVTVTFERPDYFAYEHIGALVTIVNNGTAPATGVTVEADANVGWSYGAWMGLDPGGPGITVQPGERIELHATLELYNMVDVAWMSAQVRTTGQDTDTTNDTARTQATITLRTTDLTTALYGDRDGDRVFDDGEALVGVLVTGEGGTPRTEISVRTGVGGRFTVPDVPEGSYHLSLGLPAGWQTDETSYLELRVGEQPTAVRAVRDSSDLRGTITFDKPVYAVGDTIHEHVTLTNAGLSDLSGVTARCVEGAAPNQLSGLGWGDLVHYEAPGVSVRAGETRTFDFTDVVPAGGRLYGFITLSCWFSTAFRYDDGPLAVARAEVPGGRGSTGGVLYTDANGNRAVDPGEPVPGVKVRLVDGAGTVVSRTETDAAGHYMFTDVPANRYYLRLVGPWRLCDGVDLQVGVFDGAVMDGAEWDIEPGPNQTDPDVTRVPPPPAAPRPGPAPPAPQAAPAPHPATLADTGADVAALTALGALLVALGLLLLRRRAMP
jgi:LPXTG-motif cell wall-anchored protein